MTDARAKMLDELRERREWFKGYFDNASVIIRRSRPKDHWLTCPVCGYPTHINRGSFDICDLCGWEDDGQDDPEADEVWGGPNGDYSLTEARENFAAYRTQYRPGDGGFERDGPGTETHRRVCAIVVKFEAIRQVEFTKWNSRLVASLWREINELSHSSYGELPDDSGE